MVRSRQDLFFGLKKRLSFFYWMLVVLWTLIIISSLVGYIYIENTNIRNYALIQAKASFQKDVIYRYWNSMHGGVYAPVTEITQPNPYLKVDERDIVTPNGKLLTLVNPAYMTRQVHELHRDEFGIISHITSLNPIRPENYPNNWEKNALTLLSQGNPEVFSVETIEGDEYLNFMKPLFATENCLKCHGGQGYKTGDIRGGIRISVPLADFKQIAKKNTTNIILLHVILYFLGISLASYGNSRVQFFEKKRQLAQVELNNYKDNLEAEVKKRT